MRDPALFLHNGGAVGELIDPYSQLGIQPALRHQRWTMTADPGGGLLALATGGRLHLVRLGGDPHRVATTGFVPSAQPSLAFCGPDRLVGTEFKHKARSWRLADGELHVVAERQLDQSATWPVHLSRAGVVAVVSGTGSGRRVRFLDADTLDDLPVSDRLTTLTPTCLLTSADGTRLAVGGDGSVTVTDVRYGPALTGLVDRPLAAAEPGDLNIVRAHLEPAAADPVARPFLKLLAACLEHRFGTAVRLGNAKINLRAGDIALGGTA
jgi:hypothetical protein